VTDRAPGVADRAPGVADRAPGVADRAPGVADRAPAQPRPEVPAQRRVAPAARRPRPSSPLGALGERPQSPFGGLPISEIAIFAGGVGLIVGLIQGGGAALIVGLVVCALGVVEVTAREHFSGYRSHTTLLAAIPAVGAGFAVTAAFGTPRQRALVLLAVVPVYAVLFWWLRRRFTVARQARIARPPAP
jgi:hypothetical protein